LAGLVLLLLHFSIICIYASPFNRTGLKANAAYAATYYAYPYFHQDWNLFAPPPNTNYQLFVQFENEGSIKREIFKDLLLQHQSNRFKGLEPLVITFANSIHFFEKSTQLKQTINGPVTGDINFTILEHSVKKYLQHQYKGKIQSLKLYLFVTNIETKAQRIYFN